MSESSRLIDEATRLYREEEYAAAFELFKAAAMQTPPNLYVMTYVVLSLRSEEGVLLKRLLVKYPDSVTVQKGVATALVERNPISAANICTNLLQEGHLAFEDELSTRWIRLRAAVNANLGSQPEWYNTIVEDFGNLWQTEKTWLSTIPYNRQLLLAALSAICSPLCTSALETLTEATWLPSDVRQFIVSKIAELRALGGISTIR